jgi:hypothetical protein
MFPSNMKRYQAANPGYAFQKCDREFPDAQLIQGWRQNERNGEHAVTTYEPPSTVTVIPGPRVKWGEMLFSFANQISLKPREETGWRWDAPASQLKPSLTQN